MIPLGLLPAENAAAQEPAPAGELLENSQGITRGRLLPPAPGTAAEPPPPKPPWVSGTGDGSRTRSSSLSSWDRKAQKSSTGCVSGDQHPQQHPPVCHRLPAEAEGSWESCFRCFLTASAVSERCHTYTGSEKRPCAQKIVLCGCPRCWQRVQEKLCRRREAGAAARLAVGSTGKDSLYEHSHKAFPLHLPRYLKRWWPFTEKRKPGGRDAKGPLAAATGSACCPLSSLHTEQARPPPSAGRLLPFGR